MEPQSQGIIFLDNFHLQCLSINYKFMFLLPSKSPIKVYQYLTCLSVIPISDASHKMMFELSSNQDRRSVSESARPEDSETGLGCWI